MMGARYFLWSISSLSPCFPQPFSQASFRKSPPPNKPFPVHPTPHTSEITFEGAAHKSAIFCRKQYFSRAFGDPLPRSLPFLLIRSSLFRSACFLSRKWCPRFFLFYDFFARLQGAPPLRPPLLPSGRPSRFDLLGFCFFPSLSNNRSSAPFDDPKSLRRSTACPLRVSSDSLC